MKWFQRLTDGLSKTRESMRVSMDRLLGRGPDPTTLEELEAALLGADLGARTVERLLQRVRTNGRGDPDMLRRVIADTLMEALKPCEGMTLESLIEQGPRPFVLLAVGVNGVGKTTTLAKIAGRLRKANHRPILVAADTFRAAASEQLDIWGARLGVEVVRHQHGADPAAVVFDGIAAARARRADVVLVDTAGRLHTKTNLMEELRKIKRVVAREVPDAPHETLLVLDATLGQNTVAQAVQFHETVGVTGLVLTKLDGTARGGVVVAVAERLRVPIRLLGVGESAEDLQPFHADEFVRALVAPAVAV